jgi:hypothetical protein
MKLRFFTLNGEQPAPGTIVNLRLHFDGKISSEGVLRENLEHGTHTSEESPILEFITEFSKIDGGLPIATTRTDHMGYGRVDFASLSENYQNMVLMLLAFGLASRQAKLVLEIQGSPASYIDILDVRGLYALLYTRQEFKAPLSAENGAAIGTALLDFISGTDDAFYLQTDKSSAIGPVGYVVDPDQKDYALSPESFVSRRPIKTGEGSGCEHLTPASLPLRQYSMYHVVMYDVAASKDSNIANIPSVKGTPPQDNRILWGQILEFEQEWKSLGHSLGEVKYSLALAPGEAIKIAVIDWQRNDAGSRLGANASADKLTHDQTVDRDIDDIVNGRVTEQQSGSTFMAGLAGAMDFQIPQYGISAAGRHSIGYGTSNTEGKRDVSADAHQDVHLETLQRSNLVRRQNSSVIVQATQAESNYLSARIVANMNRGHSLSILYYEVLRHLAVTTKFLRADTAILVPVDMFAFDENLTRRFRAQLEPVLLDESYRVGFAALERIAAHVPDEIGSDTSAVIDETTPVVTSNAVMASRFVVEFKTGWRWGVVNILTGEKGYKAPADTAGDIQVIARMKDGTTRTLIDTTSILNLVFRASLEKFKTLSQLGAAIPNWGIRYEDNDGWCFAKFTADIPQSINVREVQGFSIKWRPVQLPFAPGDPISTAAHMIARNEDGWNLNQASITVDLSSGSVVIGSYAFTSNSGELFGGRDNDDYVEQGINADLSGLPMPLPTSAPTTTISISTSDKKPGLSSQELADLLVNHLNANQYYYNTYVWLLMDPRERRQRISAYVGNLLAGMSDTPLAMSGNHLAFRYTGNNLPAAAREALPDSITKLKPRESIVTLPTRGIFAEAHMGHCNAAEKRDITRLWNFNELPVSLLPNIEALTAGPRGAYQGLSPDAMGSSPLGIQETPDLPAPGEAIAKALELLAKPDIFRDQSTREQVAEIMGKLIESAQPPKLTGGNIGSAFGSGREANNNGAVNDPSEWANPFQDRSKSNGNRGDSPSPTERFDNSLVDQDVLKNAKDNGVSDADVSDLARESASNSILSTGAGGKLGSLMSMLLGAKPDAQKGPSNVTDDAGRQFVRDAVIGQAKTNSRTADSLDFLFQEGWQVRKTSFNAGGRKFWADQRRKQLVIDEYDENLLVAADQLTNAVKLAFVEDDDLRRRHERKEAIFTYFPGTQSDDLAAMANFCDWISWFWTLDTAAGLVSPMLKDMCFVLAGRDDLNVIQVVDKYYAFGTGRGRASSRGFNVKLVDDGNQVRHAAASLHASYHLVGAYFVAQARELNDALLGAPDTQAAALADITLNVYCDELATEIKDRGIAGVSLGGALIAKFR